MRRTCARPGCSDDAVATLVYDYRDRQVWITALQPDRHPMTHDLCERHAESMSPPRGWVLHDDRDQVTPLFTASEAAGTLPLRRAASA